jgi:hypothetical protein
MTFIRNTLLYGIYLTKYTQAIFLTLNIISICNVVVSVSVTNKHQRQVVFKTAKNTFRKHSRTVRWVGHVTRMGDVRNAYNILVGKPERKRLLGRPRRRWEGNIRMDLRGIGWGGVDWIHLDRNRDQWWALVNTVMNFLTS